jgi:nucleoside-diphosphate-sugar epimerase
MKVFLTGATGFIGSFLAEALLNKGYEVRCLMRSSASLRWIADLDVECYYGDLNNYDSLVKGIKGVDYIFHAAGLKKARSEKKFYQVNYEGTKNLVDAVAASNIKLKRFVYISSQAAVGPSPTIQPINEKTKPNPLTYYGKSKLAAERYINRFLDKLPVTIIRPPAVYGPRDIDGLALFKIVKKGIVPQLSGKGKYISLIYVNDLVNGIIQAAEHEKALNQTYFLTNPRPYSLEEIGFTILNILGKKGLRLYIPSFIMDVFAALSENYSRLSNRDTILNRQKMIELKQNFWVCSPQKAKKDIGFEAATSLEQGFRDTLSWYHGCGWL